ncbi:hypothetical protein B484DRAFT_429786 [Ochromonadaceae sp. CCMP2298]|nr:hypothetical protein B484DRAFT_429786 [Ochromonadaceae sp. CCMP2298]
MLMLAFTRRLAPTRLPVGSLVPIPRFIVSGETEESKKKTATREYQRQYREKNKDALKQKGKVHYSKVAPKLPTVSNYNSIEDAMAAIAAAQPTAAQYAAAAAKLAPATTEYPFVLRVGSAIPLEIPSQGLSSEHKFPDCSVIDATTSTDTLFNLLQAMGKYDPTPDEDRWSFGASCFDEDTLDNFCSREEDMHDRVRISICDPP